MGIRLITMLANVLLLSNASIAQSALDANWYIGLRGLKDHHLRITMGNTERTFTSTELNGCVVATNGLTWDGQVISDFDGMGVFNALQSIVTDGGMRMDGLIASTHTHMTQAATVNGTISGVLAQACNQRLAGVTSDVIPHGRLGAPSGNLEDPRFEMVARSGTRMVEQAVANAIAAETRYNKFEPHWLSTASAGSLLLGDQYGFDAAYYAELMSFARAQGLNWTVDVGLDYHHGTADADDLLDGVTPGPPNLFMWCMPNSSWNEPVPYTDPVYKDNFHIRPGGWSCHWYSNQQIWARYFLWNGGSAAFSTVGEPLTTGIRDPRQVLAGMLSGLSLMECVPRAVCPDGSPVWPVETAGNGPARWLPIGDPLYRPYAVQSPLPVAAPAPFGVL